MPTLEAAPAVSAAADIPAAPADAYVAPHIWLDAQGRAWIDDTNVKVIEMVVEHLAWGWNAETIHEQHPGCFTPSQVHAALAYYHDHEGEFARQIVEDRRWVETLKAEMGESDLQKRLRQLKQAKLAVR